MLNVTTLLVTYNNRTLIDGLAKTLSALPAAFTVIHDSGSVDGTPELVGRLIPEAYLISGVNRGFGYGNNRCLERVETDYSLLLNSDAALEAEDLSAMVSFLHSSPDFAAVQPWVRVSGMKPVTASRGVFLNRTGRAWDAGFMHLETFPPGKPFQVPCITAAVSLWRTSVLMQAGGFDEDYFMYFEDADLSLRIGAAGWKLAVLPGASASHIAGASSSRGKAEIWETASSARILRKFLPENRNQWLAAELRSLVSAAIRGKDPVRRLKAMMTLFSGRIENVKLPERLRDMLHGDPLDRPMRRRTPVTSRRAFATPWSALRVDPGFSRVTLASSSHAVTGSVLDMEGVHRRRFTIPSLSSRSYPLDGYTGMLYIKCDNPSDELGVTLE